MAIRETELKKYLKGTWPFVNRGEVSLLCSGSNSGETMRKPLPPGCQLFFSEHPDGADSHNFVPWIVCDETEAYVYYHNGSWT